MPFSNPDKRREYARTLYANLPEEKKEAKRKYERERYHNMTPEQKQVVKDRDKKWNLENPEKRKAIRQKCQKKYQWKRNLYAIGWRKRNRQHALELTRKKSEKFKPIVFSHYSNGAMKCACCGLNSIHNLTLDHKNGNNNKNHKGGWQTWEDLVKNNFPDGYQVLCFGCNISKGNRDKCMLNHGELC